jgi:hypothetical protein
VEYATWRTRDSGIPQDSQALISALLRNHPEWDFLPVHQSIDVKAEVALN